jgi:addiction module HigA family antidote
MIPTHRIPTHRTPTHPGEMLLEEFLNPMEITQRQWADSIHVPYQRVNEIINGRRGVTPATALRLAKFFGMSADYWMNLQQRWDLYHAKKSEDKLLKTITSITPKMARCQTAKPASANPRQLFAKRKINLFILPYFAL